MSEKKRLWDARPPQYNDDRFVDGAHAATGSDDERSADDVEALIRRPARDHDDRVYECNDTTPVDYTRGPHERAFNLTPEAEFDGPVSSGGDGDDLEPLDPDEDDEDDD